MKRLTLTAHPTETRERNPLSRFITDTRQSLRRSNPAIIAGTLIVAVLILGVLLEWRWMDANNGPPSNYYQYQVQRWEQQVAQKPDDPVVWATLGGLYERMGETRKSRVAYDKALELDPGNVAALVAAADAAEGDRDWAEARDRLTRAADSMPKGGKYYLYFKLGQMEERAKDDDAALLAYEKSIADVGLFWNAHDRLAHLYSEAGRKDDALEQALLAQRFVPERTGLKTLIAKLRSAGATASVNSTMPVTGGAK